MQCFFLLSSCEDSDNFVPEDEIPELIGTWKLIQIYNDPGDGSGDFENVFQGKTFTFSEDSIVTSNGSVCYNTSTFDGDSFGTYDPGNMTIEPDDCLNQPGFSHTFEIGRYMIISLH